MAGSKKFADTAAPKATLFVRNLPYSTTQEQLEALFSDIGPVKQCFMVNDRESAAPRGFAFVKFALKDDAVRAVAELNNKPYEGRRLAVAYAQTRQKREKGAAKGEEHPSGSEGEYDEDRAVEAPSSEPADEAAEDTTTAHKPAHHHRPPSQRAAPSTADGRTVIVRNIPVNTPKKVVEKKLRKHGKIETWSIDTAQPEGEEGENEEHESQGEPTKTATVVYADYTHARAAAAKLAGAEIGGVKVTAVIKSKDKPLSAKTLKKSRVIVRNLPFSCTEEAIRKAFEVHGNIQEVTMPKNEEGKFKGFAFVQFTNVFDAGKAIAAINGTKIQKRAVAVDWTVPRDVYEKANASAGAKDETKGEGDSEDESHDDMSEQSDASDAEEQEEDEDMGSEDEGDESEEENEDSESDGFSDDEDGKAKGKKGATGKQNVVRDGADTAEGRTVFLRNVPFTASEADLRVRLLDFGDLEFVKLVVNPETRRPRGTAFAKFKTAEAAEKAIAEASKAITVGGISEGGVVVQGRSILMSLAVDRKQAQNLAEQKKADAEKKDKRNLWLAKEGHVEAGTPAAEGVSEADLKKREKGWMEKKRKLKDANFFVSTTRLSVRNIPTHIDENGLRKAFTDAVVQSDASAAAAVKKVILMRDPERKDKDGRPRSMGWAFVEFQKHEHALAALRHINNNPEYYSPQKRLIVEFTVENMAKVKIHEAKKQAQDKAGTKGQEAPQEEKKPEKKSSSFKDYIKRKQEQRKKRQEEARAKGETRQPGTGQAKPSNAAKPAAANKGRKRTNTNADGGAQPQPKRAKKGAAAEVGKPAKPAAAPRPPQANKQKAHVGGEDDGPAGKKKNRKRGREDADEQKLDALVAQYKKKLLGGSAATVAESSRWFE